MIYAFSISMQVFKGIWLLFSVKLLGVMDRPAHLRFIDKQKYGFNHLYVKIMHELYVQMHKPYNSLFIPNCEI